jgi:hypothetical protein
LAPVTGSAIPYVVIQFSWKNETEYEEDAIDDMMNRALEEDHGVLSKTRPTLGYLIKVKFSSGDHCKGQGKVRKHKICKALNIYRLPHGTTIADARDPNNPNASHYHYKPGDPEFFFTIIPGDLGITTGFWALVCGEYRIPASLVSEQRQKFHQERQAGGLAI